MQRRKGNSVARSLFVGFLSLALVLGSAGMTVNAEIAADVPVIAVSKDETYVGEGFTITKIDGLMVDAGNGYTANVTINGNIHYDGGDSSKDDAIEANVFNGGTANIQTGDLTGTNYGLNAYAETNGTLNAEVGNIQSWNNGMLLGSFRDAQINIQAGDVSAEENAIRANVERGGSVNVTTGNIEARTGAYVEVYGGNASVTTGSITGAGGFEVYADEGNASFATGDINALYSGVEIGAENSSVDIQTGNINAGRFGVAITDSDNSDITVETGDITIVTPDMNTSLSEGLPEELVAGYTSGVAVTITSFMSGCSLNVTTGAITSDGAGISVPGLPGGELSVAVQGDLTAGNFGIVTHVVPIGAIEGLPSLDGNATGQTDIFVDGTISGGIAGVELLGVKNVAVPLGPEAPVDDGSSADEESAQLALQKASEMISITTWKIELNERGNAAEYTEITMPSSSSEAWAVTRTAATEVEKKINYIIKLEQPEVGGTLEATDADGNALAQSHDYEVANEGDTVLLKVNLDEGYELLGAYNGDGEKVALLQDANGNYYVAVPKGGGVYLSVELGQTSEEEEENTTDPEDDPTPSPSPAPVNPWAYSTYEDPDLESMTYSEYVQFNEEVRDLVLKAGQGETVVVTTKRWMSFYSLALDALKARPDVTLIVQYRYAGQNFQFVIQAGTDCEALKNEEGYVGFLYFSEKLGAKAITE